MDIFWNISKEKACGQSRLLCSAVEKDIVSNSRGKKCMQLAKYKCIRISQIMRAYSKQKLRCFLKYSKINNMK